MGIVKVLVPEDTTEQDLNRKPAPTPEPRLPQCCMCDACDAVTQPARVALGGLAVRQRQRLAEGC